MSQQVNKSKFRVEDTTEKWETIEDENLAKILRPTPSKKGRYNPVEACPNVSQKLINFMDQQVAARKQMNDDLLNGLSEVQAQVEADSEALEDNQQQLELLMGAMRKNMQQSIAANKQSFKAFKDALLVYKKKTEEIESEHRADSSELADGLAQDMRRLEQKLVADTRRQLGENVRKSIINALQHDL